MPRFTPEHKEAKREEILKRASERFRADGIAAVGVRQLMSDAGMTHGGFYTHFSSRSDLISQAVAYAAEQAIEHFRKLVEHAEGGRKLEALIDAYLRPLHGDQMAAGCAAAALAPEIAREEKETRERFALVTGKFVALIASLLPKGGTVKARQERAYAIFGGLMGTLQLSRIATETDDRADLMRSGRSAALAVASQPWT